MPLSIKPYSRGFEKHFHYTKETLFMEYEIKYSLFQKLSTISYIVHQNFQSTPYVMFLNNFRFAFIRTLSIQSGFLSFICQHFHFIAKCFKCAVNYMLDLKLSGGSSENVEIIPEKLVRRGIKG